MNSKGSASSFSCAMSTLHGLLRAEAGEGVPSVHIKQIGFADNSQITPILIKLIVTTVNPALVSRGGGVLISITGQGFPKNR
jgi:hypothetical protein